MIGLFLPVSAAGAPAPPRLYTSRTLNLKSVLTVMGPAPAVYVQIPEQDWLWYDPQEGSTSISS